MQLQFRKNFRIIQLCSYSFFLLELILHKYSVEGESEQNLCAREHLQNLKKFAVREAASGLALILLEIFAAFEGVASRARQAIDES